MALPQLRRHYNISPRLLFAAGLVALFVAIPLGYIFFRAVTGGAEVWMRLLQTRIWKLLGNTLLLTAAVTGGATLVGVSMSFLTEPTPSPLGFAGAAFILTLFMFPYVYLLSAAAFRSLNASLEEASRTFGRN